jgi:Leucine-rich repeat (LRR) protein
MECVRYIQSHKDNQLSSEFSNFDAVKNISFAKSYFQRFPGKLLARFSHLERLTARYCGLKTLDVTTFGGAESDYFPTNLKLVNLYANEITNIGAKAFIRLPHLGTLYLGNNRITTIDDDAFYGLDELKKLNLFDNSIVTLNVDIFAKLRSLYELRR